MVLSFFPITDPLNILHPADKKSERFHAKNETKSFYFRYQILNLLFIKEEQLNRQSAQGLRVWAPTSGLLSGLLIKELCGLSKLFKPFVPQFCHL